ncbi:Na+/H+ antiporter [Nocardiopsis salina]|uniref:Na+/H+ antiporter n=1 Tax=Nocardiopsis salina TaxID=245836 RepID=UPI0003452EE3|nr:Na+/H+ antiporter [Nocardiopsis salina]
MGVEEYVIATLVVVVAVIVGQFAAGRLRVPSAVVLVLLGIVLGVVPWMHSLSITPEVILLVFLPPLIYNAAFFSSPKDMRNLFRPILVMSVGVTLVTAFGMASVIYLLIPAVEWPAAIALGAAVAPTDAVSASAILKRVGTPRRVMTILEGESLVNDGVALTLFSLAVTAMAHPLPPAEGLVTLGSVVVGGLVHGALVSWFVLWVRPKLRDPSIQLMVALITPFVAYVPAEKAGFSGVLAAVVAGFVLGGRGEGPLPPRVRLTGQVVWKTLVSLLEAMLFVLLGLQLDAVVTSVQEHYSMWQLTWVALVVTLVAVALRMLLVLVVIPLQQCLPRLELDVPNLRERVVIGWSGMRGAVSLAIALSLPATIGGEPFTERGGLIYIAGVVVIGTLMFQGLTLPLLLRKLGLTKSDQMQREALDADYEMSCAALQKVDELQTSGTVDEKTAEAVRSVYSRRLSELQGLMSEDDSARQRFESGVAVHGEIIQARRDRLESLYREGRIDHDVFQKLNHDLDLRDSGGGTYGD